MMYSRFCEGHRRLDALLTTLSYMDPCDLNEAALRLLSPVFSLEMSRFVNSGEIQSPQYLDGDLGACVQEGTTTPIATWFFRRHNMRLTDNTTPPMFVMRFRASQVAEHVDEFVRDQNPHPLVSFASVIGSSNKGAIGLDEGDPMRQARVYGLLPYEVEIVRSPRAFPSALPRDPGRESEFLAEQLHMLFT